MGPDSVAIQFDDEAKLILKTRTLDISMSKLMKLPWDVLPWEHEWLGMRLK